jgi:hypothetical protein
VLLNYLTKHVQAGFSAQVFHSPSHFATAPKMGWSICVFAVVILQPLVIARDNSAVISGSCSVREVKSYVTALPSGNVCYQSLDKILSPENLTLAEYQSSLATLCTVDCGEAIAKFVAVNCDNLLLAGGLHLLCTPRDKGGDRCQSVWPNLLSDKGLIDNLRSCGNFTSAQCPTGCAGAITAVVAEMGCCYQTIYNNTKVLDIFVEYELLTSTQQVIIQNTHQPTLWTACNMPLTTLCAGDSFPGESVLASGVCTAKRIETFIAGLTPTCSDFYGLLSTEGVTTEEKLNTVCQECAGKVAGYLNQTCRDPLSAKLRHLSCLHTDGKLGKRCFYCLSENFRKNTIFANLRAMCLGGGDTLAETINTCPIGCREALEELKAQLGCCYQSIYNDTAVLDAFLYREYITPRVRDFFEKLSMPEMWEICGVSLQTKCAGDPISTAAVGHHHAAAVGRHHAAATAAAPHRAIAEAVAAKSATAAAVVLQHTATASFITVMCGILIPHLL